MWAEIEGRRRQAVWSGAMAGFVQKNGTGVMVCCLYCYCKLLESYKRMSEPCLHIIDASGSHQDVLEKVRRHIKEKLPKVDIKYSIAKYLRHGQIRLT